MTTQTFYHVRCFVFVFYLVNAVEDLSSIDFLLVSLTYFSPMVYHVIAKKVTKVTIAKDRLIKSETSDGNDGRQTH